jgi:hypothetical protein
VLIPWIKPERIRRFGKRQRAVFFTAVPLLGMCIGWPLGVWLVSGEGIGWVQLSRNATIASAAVALLVSGIFFLFFNSMCAEVECRKTRHRSAASLAAGTDRTALPVQHAGQCAKPDGPRPAQGQADAGSFTDYLRASLSTLRSDNSPVAQELALAESYLQLLQARMEDRLQFSIQADETARAVPLPPLLLQPLVENAVVHGLEPSIEGGTVRVSARVRGEELVLEVQDNGLGLAASRPRPDPAGATARAWP